MYGLVFVKISFCNLLTMVLYKYPGSTWEIVQNDFKYKDKGVICTYERELRNMSLAGQFISEKYIYPTVPFLLSMTSSDQQLDKTMFDNVTFT